MPESRVARKRAERRRLVEQTAAEVFAQKGYDGANFEEIAARLDMRGASLYYYYPSKEDLFLRAIENATAEVLARLRPIAESDLPAEERLRRLFIEQVFIETRDYPAFAPLFLMSVPVPAVAERLAELGRDHSLVFRTLAHEVATEHGVPQRQASISVLLALGSLSYIHSWYNPRGPMKLEQVAEEVAHQLLQPFLGADATGLARS
ncbi:MAG TPA: TetR/AcrR family transcriptional regulator [Sporichthya sp.]|nr:TetR/AcrR family transcriptional regulator [Sporichthya sp.]